MKKYLNYFYSSIKVVLFLFLFLGSARLSNAQIICPDSVSTFCDSCNAAHPAPSTTIVGPLRWCLDEGEMRDTIIINFTDTLNNNPTIVFTFTTNQTGATVGIPTGTNTNNFEWNGGVSVNPGTTTGQFTLFMDVYVTYSDGCVMHGSASLTTTVVDVGGTVTSPPIECLGGTTTITAVGNVTPAQPATFTYTLNPGNVVNSTGIFPGVTAGAYTVTIAGEVSGELVCDTTVSHVVAPGTGDPVVLICNADTTVSACLTPQQVQEAFQNWLNGFSHSGGSNPVFIRTPAVPIAPSGCGGSVTVIDSVLSDCEDAVACAGTFTVLSAPPVVLNCPTDTTIACCQSQATVDALFAAWLATANASGGCGLSLTNDGSAPNACGGSDQVTFTVTDNVCGATQTCQATFTVLPSPDLGMTVPPDTSIPGNLPQDQVCLIFQDWLDQAQGSGGTGGIVITNDGICPPSCDGSVTVTWTLTDTICPETITLSATFTTGPCASFVGCTPGFWKNHTSIWSDPNSDIPQCIAGETALLGAPYGGNGTTSALFSATFGLTPAEMTAAGLDPNLTLLQGVRLGGGGFNKLARHGVAALLGGCSINHTFSASQVLVMVHDAIVNLDPEPTATQLAAANEVDPDECPSAGSASRRIAIDLFAPSDDIAVVSYPNPFTNSTTIEFTVNSASSRTVVEVYNYAGARVAKLFDNMAELGTTYTVQFNGDKLAEGIYNARITTDAGISMVKLVLIK